MIDGIISINKEKGFTSHDVVAIVRGATRIKKVGHTGTLDPNAEGVLPVCIGKATKIIEYLVENKKEYIATVVLGTTTTTQDSDGDILQEREVIWDESKIEEVVNSFMGQCAQIPPMYSAIKVNGRKLYQLARAGIEIERKSRDITIYNIEILDWMPPNSFKIKVLCSKGTYIRTLCNDIGEKLGCGAHMKNLIRTQTGMFCVENSVTIKEFREHIKENTLHSIVIPIEKALEETEKLTVIKESEIALLNGNHIYLKNVKETDVSLCEDKIYRMYDTNDKIIALYKLDKERNVLKILKMLS